MERREFLKISSGTAVAVAAAGIGSGVVGSLVSACGNGDKPEERGGNGEMTFRKDAMNGADVSLLGYGCMRWPVIKGEDGGEVIDQERVNALVDEAIAGGVNYFDTAPVYHRGHSEKATGIALARHPREKWTIATKLSNFGDWSREAAIAMYRRSFEELGVDTIDYYLLHSIGSSMENFRQRYVDNGVLDFLMEERRKGKIVRLGYSFHGNREMFDKLLATHEQYHWDFIQIQMNYLDWNYADRGNCNAAYMYEQLEKAGIQTVVMEPLLGGKLANVADNVSERLSSRDPHSTPASWAFRFAGSWDNILCVLSGMTYKEHLEENLRTFSPLNRLDEGEKDFLEKTAKLIHDYPTVPCTACEYCMPCPYGVDIPGNFRHYNKCVQEGYIEAVPKEKSENRDEMNAFRTARRNYLISYQRDVLKDAQANRCVNCRQCVEHCPQHIDIPHELRKIDRLVESLRHSIEV